MQTVARARLPADAIVNAVAPGAIRDQPTHVDQPVARGAVAGAAAGVACQRQSGGAGCRQVDRQGVAGRGGQALGCCAVAARDADVDRVVVAIQKRVGSEDNGELPRHQSAPLPGLVVVGDGTGRENMTGAEQTIPVNLDPNVAGLESRQHLGAAADDAATEHNTFGFFGRIDPTVARDFVEHDGCTADAEVPNGVVGDACKAVAGLVDQQRAVHADGIVSVGNQGGGGCQCEGVTTDGDSAAAYGKSLCGVGGSVQQTNVSAACKNRFAEGGL